MGVQSNSHIQSPGKPFSKKFSQRLIIYPKDVEIITGRSHRTACTILQNIRKSTGKLKSQFITITEFCEFTGIDEKMVKEFLND